MYDQIDLGKISRSGFDLSWNNKGTGKIGRIIPTRCTEVLPGDRFKGSSAAAVQFEPLAVPILANMDVRQEHFYVPNNILWKNWDKFITGGQNLDDTSVLPTTSLYNVMMALFSAGVRFPGIKLHFYRTAKSTKNDQGIDVVPEGTEYGMLAYFYAEIGDGVSQHVTLSRNQLTAFGKKYGCLDLLAPCFEVLDRVYDLFLSGEQSFYDKDNNVIKGIPVLKSSTFLPGYEDNNVDYRYWDALAALDSNMPAVIPALKKYIGTKIGTDTYNIGAPAYFPTSIGFSLIQLWYDFYRPFVGPGSNLDYLNMSRLSLSNAYVVNFVSTTMRRTANNVPQAPIGLGYFNEAMFSSEKVSVLPLRANYAIWYNYYRDQLLETIPPEPSIEDTVTDAELLHLILPRQRCWAKDTFTTALSNPGTGSMLVPVDITSSPIDAAKRLAVTGVGKDDLENLSMYEYQLTDGTKIKLPTRFISGLHATEDETSSYAGFSLDMLNRAQRAQKWLQKALIYGNRIQDRLFTSFGVKFLDNRLKLPEFLSSSRELVQLSVNTNPTTIVTDKSSTVAGDKSANAYAYDKGGSFNRFCEEHGFIMSFLTIMPEVTYAYGTSRHYSKLDKFDYAWPEFATIGMDAVYNKELCNSSLQLSLDGTREVFGYQGRYYDYKAKQDEEHGELQTTQNMYTFSRFFDMFDDDKKPKLNYIFVHCWPSLDMFVVDSTLADYFRYDIHHSVAAERPLPVCGMYL